MNEPIDALHAECLAARRWIREAFHDLRIEAGLWEPRPVPTLEWRRLCDDATSSTTS